ncbi:cytochrome c maturation protein CcmE [bacterium]|nr:cytochrome c maturation protein CcmE [bacterium]
MKPKVIALIAIMAVVIAVIVASYGETSTTVTFTEAESNPDDDFYITGQLMKDMPVEYDPVKDPNYFSFYLKDKDGEVRKVVAHEPKLQDFERATEVTMMGTARDDHFEAKKVMPKCPSKYEEELEPAQADNR